ncbi:TAXI family TRAP transporter solute-binding subunit [Candidatus Fermentibacteria bacterium]|nr:TAXI family TRAP transporter solute-binding subunit [Candidatus Fermentibacteria bacterium]
MVVKRVWVVAMGALILLAVFACSTKQTYVTIGTGGVTGIYYPTGGHIAKLVNKKRAVYGLRCTVESTGGSVFNINAVASGYLEFGIAQSDRQYQALYGLAEWADTGPIASLRAVFSIHPEAVTLVAADDAGIMTIDDLRGKRVNLGNPGSGQRQNALDALTASGLNWESDIHAEAVKADAAPTLLQDGRIDAFFYTVGHPSGNILEATAGRRRVRFIPIVGAGIDSLVIAKPYYARATISSRHYPRALNASDVPTFGVKATVVTSVDVPADIVYAVTKEVFDNLPAFKKLHPAYEHLTVATMREGLSAPLHEGALRYFREADLMEAR